MKRNCLNNLRINLELFLGMNQRVSKQGERAWNAVEAWEHQKFTSAVLEELEEINAPRYLAVSMWGTGGARESDWMGRSRKGAQDSHKHGSVAVTVLDRDLGRVR